MSNESFGAAMERLQSLAGNTLEQLDALKEAIPSMDKDERDTHFRRAAHFLLQEMSKCRFIDDDDTSLHYEEMQTLVAQFAYDLVYHALYCNGVDAWYRPGKDYHPTASYERKVTEHTNDVPDLDAWPEPSTKDDA